MKKNIIFVSVCLLMGLLVSCVEREFFEPAQKNEEKVQIMFSATTKGFTKTNVGTRAGETEAGFDPSAFENTVYNAYFLLFDNSGVLRVRDKASVVDNVVTYNIGRDVLSVYENFRICFLANVQASVMNDFTVGTTTWDGLQDYYMNMSYAPFSETGCLGVPQKVDMDDDGIQEYALPMFGSKVVNAPYNPASGHYAIELERLFARVEVLLSLGIQDDNNLLTSAPQFALTQCDFVNISNLAPVLAQDGATICSDLPDSEVATKLTQSSMSSYNLSTGVNKTLYYSSSTSPDYRSFYFYVPEHKLGNVGSNGTQSNKPSLINGTSKRPTYVSISGFLVDREGTSYNAKYNIYLGGNSTDNFDLSRNTIYRNYVRINGVNSADQRVEIDKIETIVEDVTRSGQSANCYIIISTGTYMLPAYRGAYTNLSSSQENIEMCDVGTDEVLACDNPNITITFNRELSKQSTIVFDVQNSGSDLLSGNAVIARRKYNGEIDWSWHLWFIPGMTLGSSTNDLGDINRIGGLLDADMYDGTTMADRNLGVNASITDLASWLPSTMGGIYYRYGFRNPYITDQKYNNGSGYHGLNEEDYSSWNTAVKAKTDPCPPGYRMPPISVWQGSNEQNATKEHYSGMLGIEVNVFRYWDRGIGTTDDIYYPYTGYMTSSGSYLGGDGTKDFELEDNIKVTGSETVFREWEEGSSWNKKTYREIGYVEKTYSEFKYSVPLTINIGEMLTQNPQNVFHYEYSVLTKSNIQNNSSFISAVETTYEIKQKQRYYSILGWRDDGDETRTQTSQRTIYTEPSLSTNWRSQAATDQFGSFSLTSEKKTVSSNTTTSLNSDRGYNIRCIKG